MFLNIFDDYTLFLLVLIRISGAVLINPLFGRRNVPSLVKAAFALVLSAVLTVSIQGTIPAPQISSLFEFICKAVVEFAVGYTISFICSVFFSAVIISADIIDIQLGIGMAKAFDPGSNISVPVTGSIFNAFLIVLFFISNGHITLFKLLSDTFTAIPCGFDISLSKAALAATGVIGSAFTIALKFAMPIITIELVTELGLGVLTRVVPNINVFSVGIQLKLIVGLIVLLLMAPVFGSFCDELFIMMFDNIFKVISKV